MDPAVRYDTHHGPVASQEAIKELGTEFGEATRAQILARSPTSLKVTFRQLREGRDCAFEDCMRLEYRIVHGVADGHDFYEGIRAAVIDKDGTPRWREAKEWPPVGRGRIPVTCTR